MAHIEISNASELVTFPAIGVSMPILWIYLIAVILTQYLCINSVFILATECSSLTVTLVVTLRKFASLIFSIFYFNNPFTIYHWFGTLLVFSGTMIFTGVISALPQSSRTLLKVRNKNVQREWNCSGWFINGQFQNELLLAKSKTPKVLSKLSLVNFNWIVKNAMLLKFVDWTNYLIWNCVSWITVTVFKRFLFCFIQIQKWYIINLVVLLFWTIGFIP